MVFVRYRSLISYFKKNPDSPLADLNFENCELSCCGVIEFLDTLSTVEKPLKFLSVADNALGRYLHNYKLYITLHRYKVCLLIILFLFFSEVAEAVMNSLTVSIESLDISSIGLGPVGFLELGKRLVKGVKKLMSINIRFKANFISSVSLYTLHCFAFCFPHVLLVVSSR